MGWGGGSLNPKPSGFRLSCPGFPTRILGFPTAVPERVCFGHRLHSNVFEDLDRNALRDQQVVHQEFVSEKQHGSNCHRRQVGVHDFIHRKSRTSSSDNPSMNESEHIQTGSIDVPSLKKSFGTLVASQKSTQESRRHLQ